MATNLDSQPGFVSTIDANGNVIKEAIGGDSTRNWQILAKTNDFVGDWSLSGRYQTGDVVQRGGFLYEAVRDVNLQDGDDSSATDTDPEVWNLIAKGQRWIGQCATGILTAEVM